MAEDNKKSGVYSAVREVAEAGDAFVGAEQLALLPLTSAEQAESAKGEGRGGPGRPPGARNRNTEQIRQWLLARGSHPLAALQDTYSMRLVELAKELKAAAKEAGLKGPESIEDVFKLQLYAAKELAPYVASKMPQGLTLDAPGGFSLTISTEPPAQEGDQAGGDRPMIDLQAEKGEGDENG